LRPENLPLVKRRLDVVHHQIDDWLVAANRATRKVDGAARLTASRRETLMKRLNQINLPS